jgi:hypothetical protein
MERTDEDLLDYWTIAMPEGILCVTKAVADAVKEQVTKSTIVIYEPDAREPNEPHDAFICPLYYEFVDLFGSATAVRLDQVGTIANINPEIRAMSERQDKLLAPEKKDWER